MPEEDELRTELMGLLRYANATAVGKALGVSAQTVTNWARGKHPSQARLDQVRALYGLPVASQGTTKEAAEPSWVQRLEARLIDLRENQERVARIAARGVVTALGDSAREAWADRIAEKWVESPTQSDEASGGRTEPTVDPGAGTPEGQESA